MTPSVHRVTNTEGAEIEVLTREDPQGWLWSTLKWFMGSGLLAVVVGTLALARFESRVSAQELRIARDSVMIAEIDLKGSDPFIRQSHDVVELRTQIHALVLTIEQLRITVVDLQITMARKR